ncbi:MAG: IclR family transcriptional regulator [Spirochaetes bacterium]|nr:IclR family transcriptional regulator [Spirochaetota bacterium]MBL7005755.1 IclR family transcriptional regulator [Spirochaetia bacterium]
MSNNYQVPVLEKTFRIIEKISLHKEGISFMEIVNSLEESKTTVFRILSTLEKQNWIEKKSGFYHLGYMFIHYGLQTLTKRNLRTVAHPVMQELTNNVQQTSHIAILAGKSSMLLDVCESSRHIKPSSDIGSLLPLNCTSHGKVLLAFAIEDSLENFLKNIPLERKTEHTLTTIAELQQDIGKIRSRGYALDDLEYFEDVRCIAAPVWGMDGLCIGALGITATASTFPRDKIKAYGTIITDYAKRISLQLGGVSYH